VEASRASLSPYGPIDLLYLHAPDAATEIEQTLAELKAMHDEGAFVNLGLSNFPAWEVAYIHGKCEDIGLPPPTTYQGMYNCLTRAVEPELLPALRKLNMRFLAYNPLAGGLLTGKHRGKMDDAQLCAEGASRGRFTENKMYRDRFWNERYFAAVDTICAACETNGVAPAEAALRWLYSHSRLDGAYGDGVILGASSAGHLEANLAAAEKAANGEALPESVLEAIEAAFEVCAPVAPPYSRGHSKIAVGR
jgi:aflatoxin B1 aldehyde reductase